MHKHSVESNKRATRRHHAESLKKRYKKYSVVSDPSSDKQLGKVLQCPKECSCDMCCNDRRNPWAMNSGRTMQELRSDYAFADGVCETDE